MRKLKEWKDIISSKIREHKKQSITIMLALLIVIAGVGTGMYYAYLPDQASALPKETEITQGKEDTEAVFPAKETRDFQTAVKGHFQTTIKRYAEAAVKGYTKAGSAEAAGKAGTYT